MSEPSPSRARLERMVDAPAPTADLIAAISIVADHAGTSAFDEFPFGDAILTAFEEDNGAVLEWDEVEPAVQSHFDHYRGLSPAEQVREAAHVIQSALDKLARQLEARKPSRES